MSKWSFIRQNLKCLATYTTRHLYRCEVTIYSRGVFDITNPSLTDSIRDWGFITRPFNDLPSH